MMNKVSIIIPVYNVEKYLPACLNSVLNQTHQNVEIILINDGSTDSSAHICDEYARRDGRIQVMHQQNAGVAVARNAGLQKATGDFISFVDADDLLHPEFYTKLLGSLQKHHADIVECGFLRFANEEDLPTQETQMKGSEKTYATEKALELLIREEIKQMPCNKLFTAQVNKGILFPPGRKHEDDFWAYLIVGNAKKIVVRDEVLYFYRQHIESNMGRKYNVTRLEGLLAIEQRIAYMRDHFPNLENAAAKTFCLGALWHYQQLHKNKEIDPDKSLRKNIIHRIKKYNKVEVFSKWKPKEIFWYQFFRWLPDECVKCRTYMNIGI